MKILSNFPYSPFTRKAGSGQRFLQQILGLRDLGHQVKIWSIVHESKYKWTEKDIKLAYESGFEVLLTDDWVLPDEATENIDLAWVNYYLMVEKFGNFAGPICIDQHDLLSCNDQLHDLFSEHMQKVGYKNTYRNSPEIFKPQLVPNFPISEQELEVYRKASGTVAISRKEQKRLIANGINCYYIPSFCFEKVERSTNQGLPIYTGSDNLNNLFANDYLGEVLLPRIRMKCDMEVQILGEMGDRCFHYPGIKYWGYQQDQEVIYKYTSFGLNTLRISTGQKIKMMDYLARGLPVIAFKDQIDDSPIIYGETGFPVKDVEEFCDQSIVLHKDARLRRRMGDNAVEAMKQFYSKDRFMKDLEQVVLDSVANHGKIIKRGNNNYE